MNYYGNLAYKPEIEESPVQRKKKKIKETEKANMLARKTTIFRILYILTLAFAAVFMISKYVAVYDTGESIKELNRELEQKQSYASQKIFEMEQSVDLSEVERVASERLDMQRPEKHQIIYVDVKQDNVSEMTASEVEGIGNRCSVFFEKLMKNIIGIFSIK